MSEGLYKVEDMAQLTWEKLGDTFPDEMNKALCDILNAAHKAGVEEGRKQIIAAIQEAGLDDDARDGLLLSIAANTAADWLRSLK